MLKSSGGGPEIAEAIAFGVQGKETDDRWIFRFVFAPLLLCVEIPDQERIETGMGNRRGKPLFQKRKMPAIGFPPAMGCPDRLPWMEVAGDGLNGSGPQRRGAEEQRRN